MAEVAVLLATYNGARFLREQIESLYRQTHEDWTLLASDDGSTDATRDILTRIASDRLTDLREGPRQGASANFLSLLARVPRGSYAAFCDQDDVWEPEKLTRALALLPDPTTPALYCARTQVCDASLTPITLSKRPLRGLSIENALVQNVASGNTLVLTPAAVQHLQAMPAPEPCPAHDWWCYLALAATGAELIYDPWPCLAYRQHGANTLGASLGPLAKLSRLQATRRGDLAGWIAANLAALRQSSPRLTPRADHAMRQLERRLENPSKAAFSRLPVHRQSPAGQAALRLALLAGWLSPSRPRRRALGFAKSLF